MIFNRKEKKLKTYIALLEEIGHKKFLMPIEEIRLANQFAELNDSELLKKTLLVEKYLNHNNFHVKRVIAIAFRRLAKFDESEINKAMIEFMNDSAHWVVYDAIWYFQESKTADESVIQKIKDIYQNTELTEEQLKETSPSSDPTVNMKWMAKDTLEIIN